MIVRAKSLWLLAFFALNTALLADAENVTLKIVRELVLRDVGDVVLTPRFRENVDKYLRRHTDRNVKANVYKSQPDVTVVARAWFTGDSKEATASYNRVKDIFDSWEAQPNDTLISDLNNVSLRELGVQPRLIELSDQCKYGESYIDQSAENFGFNNLTLEIRMSTNPQSDLRSRLCRMLPFVDCSLIVLDVVKRVNNLYTTKVTITSPNRNYCLVVLMNNFHYAAALLPDIIENVVIAGKEVFRRPSANMVEDGRLQSPCARRFWYLIFLLLLIPLSLFVGHKMYYSGLESGRKAARALERDIRGGVRYQGQASSQPLEGWQYMESNYAGSSSNGSPRIGSSSRQTNQSQRKVHHMYYDPNENWQNNEVQMMRSSSTIPSASSRQQ